MLGHGPRITAQTLERPVASALSVGHRLQRCESLRRNDEQRLGRIKVASRLYEVCPVYVGDESAAQRPIAVVLQCFIRHDRTEIGATNADVDDIADPLARVTFPFAA